jgi:hypothetical protein
MGVVVTAQTVDHPSAEVSRVRVWPWAIAAACLVVVVGVFGARWYSGLSLLMPYPVNGNSGVVSQGHTIYTDTGLYSQVTTDNKGNDTTPRSLPLTVTAITPRVDSNTSGATFQVLVCQRNGGYLGVGSQEIGLSDSCSAVTPVTSPMTINLGFMTAQVLVAVTPHQTGQVHITGFDVTYTDGIRHATQQAGTDLTITTP